MAKPDVTTCADSFRFGIQVSAARRATDDSKVGHNSCKKQHQEKFPWFRLGEWGELSRRSGATNLKCKQICVNFGYVEIFTKKICFWQYFIIHDKIVDALTFKSLEVTLRTTRFKIQKFYMALALHWVFCTKIRTATFALYSINWLVFIAVVESVYCTVRIDSLNKADYVSSLKG